MSQSTLKLRPVDGWSAFAQSSTLTDLLWHHLQDWQHLNLTSDTSVWEAPDGSGTTVYVEYVSANIVAFVVQFQGDRPSLISDLLSEVERRFAVRAVVDGGTAT